MLLYTPAYLYDEQTTQLTRLDQKELHKSLGSSVKITRGYEMKHPTLPKKEFFWGKVFVTEIDGTPNKLESMIALIKVKHKIPAVYTTEDGIHLKRY